MFIRRPAVRAFRRRLSFLGMIFAALGCLVAGAARPTAPATTRTAPSTPPATRAASNPATKPAPANPPAAAGAKVLQADDLLANFPRNATTSLSRNARVTVEGRVRDVRTLPTSTGPVVRLVLVGKLAGDDDAAHMTCSMDKAAEASALALKPGTIVKVTGTFDGIVAASDRIELTACRDLTVLPAATQLDASMVVGHWRGNVAMTAEAFRQWAASAGWVIGEVNTGVLSTPLLVDLTFKGNGVVTQVVHVAGQTFRNTEGSWAMVKGDNGVQVTITMSGMQPFDTGASITGKVLTLNVPGLAEMNIIPKVGMFRVYVTPIPEDITALKLQATQWVTANVGLPNPKQLLTNTATFLDNCEQLNREFNLYFDGGLLKSKKSTEVCCINGKMMVLEYTAAQAQRTGVAAMASQFKDIRIHLQLAAPEIKVDVLSLDTPNTLQLSKPLTGKLTMRSIRHIPDAKYMLYMNHERGFSIAYLDKSPGPDNELFDFTFAALHTPPGDAFQPGKTVPVFFSLARGEMGESLSFQVSEPIGKLMDIAP